MSGEQEHDEDRLSASELRTLNEHGDPYPLDVVRPSRFRRVVETFKRAFSTSLYKQQTFESEAEALKPFQYGGLAVRYLTWRASVMMIGVVFLVYTVGMDIIRTIGDIVSKQHHHAHNDLYRKIFGVQVLVGSISDSIYALSLLVSLCFWVYAVTQWKNYRVSAKALRVGYIISFCTPFLLMLTFEYRAGINIPALAADACHSVLNGRIPDIMGEIKATGSGGNAHNAKKRAKELKKPSVVAKFKHLVADHVPKVNLTDMFHTLNVQMPSNICNFHKSSWSEDVKQDLINAGFVRDQRTNMCGASVKALKMMRVLPKNYVSKTPGFRHLLEETSSDATTESEEVFSFNSEKHFTKEQCKPCESCVDPDCRKMSVKVLGKQFSMIPAFHKALHAVRTAKTAMKAFKKSHEAAIKKAEQELKHMAHHAADKFTKELEKVNPKFKAVIEAGKKAAKELDVKGALALHKFDKKLKDEYKKLKEAEHKMLINLEKEGRKHVSRARKHGKHAHMKAKKKFEKKFKKAAKEAAEKLKKAKKAMMHKIRTAKAKFLAKKAAVVAKLAAARHARLAHSKGGNKMLLTFKSKLFSRLEKLKAGLKRKLARRKKLMVAELHKLKAKYTARLAKTHHSKRYVEHLKEMYTKVAKSKGKVLRKLKKTEAKMAARVEHAKAQFKFFSNNHDISKLLAHIKKHAVADAKKVEHLFLHAVKNVKHTGLFRLRSLVKTAKAEYTKVMAAHKLKYSALRKAAKHKYALFKAQQHHKLATFELTAKKALAKAKKIGKAEFKKVSAETAKEVKQFKKDYAKVMDQEREKMRQALDEAYHDFKKVLLAARAKFHGIKAKAHKKSTLLKFLSTHASAYKAKYLANKLKYKEAYKKAKHVMKAKLELAVKNIRAKMASHKGSKLFVKKLEKELAHAASQARHDIAVAKHTMKVKTLKGKFIYKAHKAEMKHALDRVRKQAAAMVERLHKHHKPNVVNVAARKLLSQQESTDVKKLQPVEDEDHFADVSESEGERALSQVEEFESDEEEDQGHQSIPAKCHSCHAACFKNCAAQYFGPALLKNTVNSYMCMGSKELNSIDTIKSAMDNVNQVDVVLGTKDGLMAFALLLPAALSFLSAVLKASKLVKQVLPQSRLAGYLIVMAAVSNIPIMAAIISVIYQSVGNVYFCIGVVAFLCTFLCFIIKSESMVASQSHESATEQITKRGNYTLGLFLIAGVFLGIFMSYHVAVLRMALKMPLKMLIIKKIADFLGRTMFTFVVIVDLLFYVFDKLYGDNGELVEGQAFEIPLKQIKRLFVDRKQLFAEEEAKETEAA